MPISWKKYSLTYSPMLSSLHQKEERLQYPISKLETGNIKLETKPAPIVSFLKNIVLSFTSLAESQKIEYHFKHSPDNPVLYFDADKLEKILTNLLSNAFKFTPKGGKITVSDIETGDRKYQTGNKTCPYCLFS